MEAGFELILSVYNSTMGAHKLDTVIVEEMRPVTEQGFFTVRTDESVGRFSGTYQLHEYENGTEVSGTLHTVILDLKWTGKDGLDKCSGESSGTKRPAIKTCTITLDGKVFRFREPAEPTTGICGALRREP